MKAMDRREVLKAMAAGLTFCASRLNAQQGDVRRVTDKLAIVDGGGANVVAFSAGDGFVLVDSGAPKSGEKVMAALKGLDSNAKVPTLFNTHYHLDQTGNNE